MENLQNCRGVGHGEVQFGAIFVRSWETTPLILVLVMLGIRWRVSPAMRAGVGVTELTNAQIIIVVPKPVVRKVLLSLTFVDLIFLGFGT